MDATAVSVSVVSVSVTVLVQANLSNHSNYKLVINKIIENLKNSKPRISINIKQRDIQTSKL